MNPVTQVQKGVELHRAGQLDGAEKIYRQVLSRWPKQPDALYLLGVIVQQKGAHEEAVKLFSQAIAVNPKSAHAYLQCGLSLLALRQAELAVEAFQAAIQNQRDLAEAHFHLGKTLHALRRVREALVSLREATRLSPKDAMYWLILGVASMDAKLLDEAVNAFGQAIRINPALPEAHAILGHALVELKQFDEARSHLQEALRLRPNYPEALHNMARLHTSEGLLDEAEKYYRAMLAQRSDLDAQSNLVFLLNYLPSATPETHFAEHKRWGEWAEALAKNFRKPLTNTPEADRPLRIGYISCDFREHPVVSFFEPVLKNHRHADFQIYCYARLSKPDETTARLKTMVDQWRDITMISPVAVAELIRKDAIDILIDLSGHTTDHALLVFAMKPAPVQATWIGYPNTTGLTVMDYRITDAVSDPPGETEAFHTERLERLPGPFSCYMPPEDLPPVAPAPCLTKGHVTFGSFNNFRKISLPTVELWSRLLREIPESTLYMKYSGLNNRLTLERLQSQFSAQGIDLNRITFDGAWLTKTGHFEAYGKVDIALDPFPYNGTTTTCEALVMGVPVVALIGKTHVARVSYSLLTHMGHAEWAAATPDEYINQCRALASDPAKLGELRSRIRNDFLTSPICNAPEFTANFELSLRGMWKRWCHAKTL